MQAFVRQTTIVYPRLTRSGENMLEPKQGVRVRSGKIMSFWGVFPQEIRREPGTSYVLQDAGSSTAAPREEFQAREDRLSAFLEDHHVAWMRWFENEIEARYRGTSSGLEIIADVLEEGLEDPRGLALAFIHVVIQSSDSDKESLVIANEQKEHLGRFVEQLAVRMGLRHPDMVAATAVVIIEQTIVRTVVTGSLKEAHTARLLFQCLQHT